MRLAFTPRAVADLDDIAFYIAFDNPGRAASFIAEIESHCRRIADHPLICPLREEYGDGVRLAVHGRYLILFRTFGDLVRIERVIHGARSVPPIG